MLNAFASAHDELAACQSAEFGAACEAKIGTQTVAAVIYENGMQDIFAPSGGGIAQSGTQMIAVKKSLLTNYADTLKFPNGEPPKNKTPTVIRGIEAFVLDVNERDGIFYITTGDPAARQ